MIQVLFLSLLIGAGSDARASSPLDGIRIDSRRLSPSLQRQVRSDLGALVRMKIHAEPDSPFPLIFGGNGNDAVMRYLRDRVKYVGLDETVSEGDPNGSQNFAVNMSSDWLNYFYERDIKKSPDAKHKEMHFESTTVVLDSPRVGFIGIGKAYMDSGTTKMDRLNTWIHEARHSDCPAVPGWGDLAKYGAEKFGQISRAGRACGYLHMTCPKGHPLAGEDACDDLPWGAYAVGHVYSKTLYKSCSNCTEKERQAALVSATEDFSRLTPQLQEGLKKGTYPRPDMRSLK